MNRTRNSTDLAPEAAWFKSSYSSGSEGNCVEAAGLNHKVGVRDSKDKTRPALAFSTSAWASFVNGLSIGQVNTRI
ncbi:DUF397 domain-containing protein [Streptomyces sp. NPDC093223]|uniref:DUF397 domain-containing protein n=1 Tax=Streptomyces sp. NPDC093223 TaxID=3366033 RepID=UPI003803442A